MVSDSGAKKGADQLRPLNRPRPVTVLLEGECPAVLIDRGQRQRISRIQDAWRIDDEWWREPISRRYYRLVLENGSLRTLYQDLVTGLWYEQAY